MAWPSWPIDEDKALARYVLPEMAERVRLEKIVRDDEIKNGNRLTVVRAIYEALAACDFRYAREMHAPDDGPQIIRDPGEMLTGGGDATCLDLALLFAGVCLGHELLPLVVIVEGHAFVAVSLPDDPRKSDSAARIDRDGAWVNEGVLLDGNQFRQLIAENGHYVPVECTGFAKTETLADDVPEGRGRKNGQLDFEAAIAAGRSQCNERKFRFAVDPALRQRAKKVAVYGPLTRHVDFGPQIFRSLAVELEHAERHPNRADLEAGAYFRNDIHHANIHGFLDTDRRCLIVGNPGHGKTALAKAIGSEIMARDARQRVFYIQAGIHRSSERWLYHIKTFDHDWVTFILDDCHQEPLQVGALLAAWPDIRNARILLVSWPLDARAAPAEEDFQEVLHSVSVRLSEPTPDIIGQIVEHIVKRNHLAQREPGPLNPVMSRCRGDLHILDFLVRAWQMLPTGTALCDVPEERILESVYVRYLGAARELYRRHVAAIAALSQFEIPVESRWLQDESAIAALRTDSFVERFSELVDGVPLEFLRYFHSTPARYVVQAAHRKGIFRTSASDEYVLDRLVNYIQYLPGNLFQVFVQLARGGHFDLQNALFADKTVIEAVDRFVGLVRMPSGQWLYDFSRVLSQIWRWQGEDSAKTTQRLLQTFKARVSADERLRLYLSSSLVSIHACLRTMRQLDPFLAREMVTALDWQLLGEQSRHVSVGLLERFFENAREADVSAADLNIFCSSLDLKGLGERFHDVSLARVRRFIECGRRAGVSSTSLNTFVSALDLKGLGERSRIVGLRTLMNFLDLARQIDASATTLNSFCQGLDWGDIGQRLAPTIDKSPPLFYFHSVYSSAGVTTQMAREFIEGLGWDAVRLIVNLPSGPDVVAALRRLLVKKCGYARKELAAKDVSFTFDTWLRSFVERPCPDVAPQQKSTQSLYLRFALNGLRDPPQALGEHMRDHRLTLHQWNLLVRSVKLVDAEYCRTELEPLLRDMPQPEMTELLRSADLLNLGIFASCFAPESGCFEWRPRVDSDIPEADARAMIVTAAALAEISHVLFSLRYIGVPQWCAVLADVLDHEPTLVQDKLITADLKTVDFFLWNLLTARDSLHAPSALSDDSITQGIVGIASGGRSDQERLTAICGTLHLWRWPQLNELLPFLVEESVVKICEAAAKRKAVKLIRLAAGLAALRPVALPARSYEVILGGLAALRFPLNVPSQSLALERVRQWSETPWSL